MPWIPAQLLSFPADSVNGQAFYPPHIYPNGMHPSMRYPPVPLAQEGAATSARPFSRPTSISPHVYPNEMRPSMYCPLVPPATSVPAHVVYGPPPHVHPNGMQSLA